MAEKYTPLFCTKGILDLPDEILTLIILLLTPRERVPLGDSCRRLRSLVFEDRKLLKYLDFSKKAGLTKMTDIQKYFNNENACQYILRVDARNVDCLKAGDRLNNSIGRAINLVDVNIHGTKFEDIWELRSFLEPLRRLDKLSIDWPESIGDHTRFSRRILGKPFKKLTYLSVRFEESIPTMFTRFLSLCKQLKKLSMESLRSYAIEETRNSWDIEIKKLRNLKIVHYYAPEALKIKEQLATVLPEPKKWTDFQKCGGADPQEFYIEKDVEVCAELLQSTRLEEFLTTDHQGWWWEEFNLKWALDPDCLLKEVLRITHEEVPEDFCCLSPIQHNRRHLLKVDEAKLLLKNPRYQISHLCLNHKLERDCDMHLLASAYPNLSELVLHSVSTNQGTSQKHPHFQRRLNRRCSTVPEEEEDLTNLDSSFKMLVENTPNLRHFRLDPDGMEVEDWDLDALHLISGWQNLETLDIRHVPIEDSQSFTEIGKRCKNLQKVFLRNFWSETAGNDNKKVAFFQMLEHCRNLRDFTIEGSHDQVEMFSLLAKNAELERVEASENGTSHSAAPWVSSFENLVLQCTKLNTIICDTKFESEDDVNDAVSALGRIKAEFRGRPDFQIQVICFTGIPEFQSAQVGTAFEYLPPNETFPVNFIPY